MRFQREQQLSLCVKCYDTQSSLCSSDKLHQHIYCAQRERFVKLFSALKPCSLGRLFSLFKVIMKRHLFVPFLLCLFLFSVLCPFLFYLRGCCQTKRSTVFLTFLQVTDRGRGRGKKIFLSFFPIQASIILYALKNLVA